MAVGERKIVRIDEEKCNGCGICVNACHEGAIQMVDGKAKLVSDIYCDGLGDCLGPCPTGAISIITRAAEDYDAPAVSELMNWPVQLALVPPAAPYLKGADILLAADCAGFAAPDFHTTYLRNKPLIIACPKLEDNAPQIAKLAAIIAAARPASITVLRMEVPCCGGLVRVAQEGAAAAGVDVPISTIVLGVDGGLKP